MTGSDEIFTRFGALGIIPVVEVEVAGDAVPLAHTLAEAGLPVMELTFRTPAALGAIELVAIECPDVLLGAGTLLEQGMVTAATRAGARFGVSPGLDVGCIERAATEGLPFVPGVVTPTDVLTAVRAGARWLKFFPAGAYGGVATLSALAGPFAGVDVRFMPTGGINAANVAEYLALPSVFAVGGTWIAPRTDITAGRDVIAARARDAAALVGSLALDVER